MPRHGVDQSRRQLAIHRGELYLEDARKYLAAGDCRNAYSTAEEGLRLVSRPFYVAVRDQLQGLIDQVKGSVARTRADHHQPINQTDQLKQKGNYEDTCGYVFSLQSEAGTPLRCQHCP